MILKNTSVAFYWSTRWKFKIHTTIHCQSGNYKVQSCTSQIYYKKNWYLLSSFMLWTMEKSGREECCSGWMDLKLTIQRTGVDQPHTITTASVISNKKYTYSKFPNDKCLDKHSSTTKWLAIIESKWKITMNSYNW